MRKILVLSFMCSSLLWGQISPTQPSVAAVDDPLAVKYNPAGLAFHNHTEAMMFTHYDGQAFTKDFAYYSQNEGSGFGYQWDVQSARNIWSISNGFKISKTHAMGLTYSFDNAMWDEGRLDLGWMHRPLSMLALGLNVQNSWSGNEDDLILNYGVAFQNKSGRWGAGLDLMTQKGESDSSGIDPEYSTGKTLSAFIEPVEGLRVNAFVDLDSDDSKVGISLSFNFPDIGFESHGVSNDMSIQTIGFRTTENPYRSIFGEKPVGKDTKTYIRLKLEGLFIEEPEMKKPKIPFSFDIDIPFLSAPTVYGKQLKKFVDQLDEYTNDEDIHGLIIDLGFIQGGFSKISELRNAFQRFHDAGKEIIVYSKFGYSNLTTYLLSMADEIYCHEMAGVDLRGLAMEVTFFRGLLDTLSIVPEVWRVSPYKTAADPFLNDSMSDAMRTNYSQLLDGIYDQFVEGISAGKGWTSEKTVEVINNGPYMLTQTAIDAELLTNTMYPDEFNDYVKDLNDGKVNIIKPVKDNDDPEYQYAWRSDKKDRIAVIYAVGGIISGKTKPTPAGSKNMGDETIAQAIKEAREDESVKAIVLRIDSGGGSALASDIMWREILKTTETDSANIKPFIASMSDVAASGGYYIACQADSIIAYPSTITGSIGVIGMRLNFSQLQERFGVYTEGIKKGDRADFASANRLASDDESDMILASINDIYIKFKERVIKGREGLDDIDALDSLALGRVWTGVDAKEYGLIDELGGYYDAIELAKSAAGITGDVEILELPNYKKKPDFKKLLGGETSIDLVSADILESIKVMDLIPIMQGGEIQMIMPVKVEIK